MNKDLVNNIIKSVNKSFNYKINNVNYFITAFTHKSISSSNNYERLEILGDATMVTVKIGKTLVSIKADKNFRANIEDKVSVKIPAQKCHLFDKKTGERVGGINTS